MPKPRQPGAFPLLLLLAALCLGSCGSARHQSAGSAVELPHMHDDHIVTADRYWLPLSRWLPQRPPRAVVLGLHGFSDYSRAFDALKETLVEKQGVAIYAYDQRGFGASANPGIWPGTDTLVADARTAAALVRRRHPDLPLYLIGESMGAAVALLAQAGTTPLPLDGMILISPAVWGFDTMPWYQRLAMWLGMRLAPGHFFTSALPEKLGIRATDDLQIIRELMKDPLMQRGSRVDTLYGLSELMTAAAGVRSLAAPTLVLYAPDDLIIPARPVCHWLRGLSAGAAKARIALYPDGYHMLTRYSGSEPVIADIAAWLLDPKQALPSGTGEDLVTARERLCGHRKR